MSEKKACRKKLTDAGAAGCVFSLFALLAAAAGTVTDLVGAEYYSAQFGSGSGHVFAGDVIEYGVVYGGSAVMAVVSLAVFIICAACCRKKKLGAELGGILAIFSLVNGASLAAQLYKTYDYYQNEFDAIGSDADFYYVMSLLVSALPLVSCIMLFICGVFLWGRCVTDDFSVNCPVMKRQPIETADDPAPAAHGRKADPEPVPSFEFQNSNYQQEALFSSAETSSDPLGISFDKKSGTAENAAPELTEYTEPIAGEILPLKHDEAVIPESIKCSKCGEDNRTGVKFCRFCGSRLA